MELSYIERLAEDLADKYATRNPYEICRGSGIIIEYEDFEKLKGMYINIKNSRYIVLSSELDKEMEKLVCAHELGHDLLHRELAKDRCLQDAMLYDMTSKPEYEANEFAASLLITDDDIMDLAQYGYTAQAVAAELGYDINLIAIKLNLLRRRGRDINVPDFKSSFLK